MKFLYSVLMLTIWINVSNTVDGGNILIVPILFKSHIREMVTLGKALVNRGHSVYFTLPEESQFTKMVTEQKVGIKSFRVDNSQELMESKSYMDSSNTEFLGRDSTDNWAAILHIESLNQHHCDFMMHDEAFLADLRSQKFDLVITDVAPFSMSLMTLSHHIDVPFIAFSSSHVHWMAGIPALPSFSTYALLPWAPRKTFAQKLQTALFMEFFTSSRNDLTKNTTLLDKFAPGKQTWMNLMRDAQLFLQTRDFILEGPEVSMPHVAATASYSMEAAKPLTSSMLNLVRAKPATIVMSFGSRTVSMPDKLNQLFVTAFRQLDGYNIIWKTDDAIAVPKHVHKMAWIPQNDLLSHASVKLFIGHCGCGGIYETLYHNVPIICFPLYGDQPHNAHMIESQGYGLKVDLQTATADDVLAAFRHVLGDQKIHAKVQLISRILKERIPPREEAADWVEYIMKFGGQHLRPVTMDMPIYEMLCLDIVGLAVLIMFIVLVLMYSFIKCICRCVFSTKSKKSKSKRE